MLLILVLSVLICNINCLDVDLFNKYFKENYSSNVKCQLQKEVFIQSLKDKSEWALNSKFPFSKL